MLLSLRHFIYMSGYGFYVWPAYATVLAALFIEWRRTTRQSRAIVTRKRSHE